MSSTFFSVSAAKPCNMRQGNAKYMSQRLFTARAEVTYMPSPKQSSIPVFPELTKAGISLTDLRIKEVVQKQSQTHKSFPRDNDDHAQRKLHFHPNFLEEAYERCRNICAEYAKTFYLGTLLMTEERRRAIWAIYVWCRRTDELVDGPNAAYMSSEVLQRWEERLQDIFDGRPYDMLDAALIDTVSKFPLDIEPFRDMIEGMRMDTRKCRYTNFQELYLYCYYVAGTVGLMTVPIMGISPESLIPVKRIYDSALYLGIGNQLTNILRDVGEDNFLHLTRLPDLAKLLSDSAMRGRVYLPQDELAQFGLSDKDVFSRKVTSRWREFMKEQITRARFYFSLAEEGASQLDNASRWPVWSSLLIYREILDAIEENDYDNFTKRACVGRAKKLLMLPLAYTRSLSTPSMVFH